MIRIENNVFFLQLKTSSYWFEVTAYGHLRQLYYGPAISIQDPTPIRLKHTQELGGAVVVDSNNPTYCLDYELLEYSATGRGDFRESPIEVQFEDGAFNLDLRYAGHDYWDKPEPEAVGRLFAGLPLPDMRDCEMLVIKLSDEARSVAADLIYLVYPEADILLRSVRVSNDGESPFRLQKLMSMALDLPNRAFSHLTLHGMWAKEAHVSVQPVAPGAFVNQSLTGTSSNQHNPGLMLVAGDDSRYAYGFNLIYSGNHYASVSLSGLDLCRIQQGINPTRFQKTLQPEDAFTAPPALLTFSNRGENGVSQQFHAFINAYLLPAPWRNRPRPIVYNNWEATFFDFSEKTLLRLAAKAKRLGCEVFMLDDGWFGRRNDDRSSLGDYHVNNTKFPNGLKSFFDRIRGLGLDAGIWVEPEMISADSDLYRAHPEYVLADPAVMPATGRHQLVLDLCNPAVRDYIVDQLSALFDALPLTYVKWDMNRNLSDVYSRVLQDQGEVYHEYCLGLYDILRRVFLPRPHLMLEMCSSGGNRFDLGMLAFASLIWSSDNTDPIERLKIQGGLSHFYPPSVISNHVSSSPHQSTLRQTPLSTRFNVAAFGVLGYELDLTVLTPLEQAEITEQIAYYKARRELFQFGLFTRLPMVKDNKVSWQASRRDQTSPAAVVGWFQTESMAVESFDRLICAALDPDVRYKIKTKPQRLYLDRFGELVKHALPLKMNPKDLPSRSWRSATPCMTLSKRMRRPAPCSRMVYICTINLWARMLTSTCACWVISAAVCTMLTDWTVTRLET